MRFSVFTIASAAIAAAGTNAIDVQEIPGYESIPEPTTNKYSEIASSVVPTFSIDSFEPTYMPDEDLRPTGITARSVATPTQSTPVDGSLDDSYEAFVKWMISRGLEGYTNEDVTRHVARDVASPTATPKADVAADGPSDESYEAFAEWMESRHLEGEVEKAGVRNHARSVAPPTDAAADGPTDDSYEAFVKWMDSRGLSEQVEHHARSLDDENEYPFEEEHGLYARSAYPEEEEDQHLDWSQVFNDELQLHARSLEDEPIEGGEYEEYAGDHDTAPVGKRSEPEKDYPVEEDFEQFLARHGYSPEDYSTPTESHKDVAHPEAPVASEASIPTVVALPAAAPTPKPTYAALSPSPTPTSAASQWSEVASETLLSSSTYIQARSVSSHFRFRHHTTSVANPPRGGSSSGTVSATSAATSSSSPTSRWGFFGLPW